MSNRGARRGTVVWGLAAWAIVLAAGAVQAGDWPAYRHDSARIGWTADPVHLPLSQRWVYAAPDRPRMAWPGEEGNRREGLVMVHRVKFDDVFHVAVVKDRVYFGSSVDNRVYCLRVADGRTQWSFCTGGPVRLAPTVGKDRVWFGSDDGYAYCLEAGSGRLLWKVRAAPTEEWLLARGDMISRWPVRTGVLVDRGVAYFGAGIFPHKNVYPLPRHLRRFPLNPTWSPVGSTGQAIMPPSRLVSCTSLPCITQARSGRFEDNLL